MKALVGAFNQEKALVGAFSVIVQPVVEPMDRFAALITNDDDVVLQPAGDRGAGAPRALQDPPRHLAAGHGGGQPAPLVPRQQVRLVL